MKNKVVVAFFATFLSLAVISAILFLGFNIDLVQWYWKVIIAIIMFGIPFYVYFKEEK